MSIVTRTGDNGDTGLVGGSRVPKSDVRLHAVGTADECNAALGIVLAEALPAQLHEQLVALQHLLFRLGADLASPMDAKGAKRIDASHVRNVESWIEELERTLPPLTSFILPGGSPAGSALHLARTICRRAERWAVALAEFEEVNRHALVFLNRLSDYLFLAAREANRSAGAEEQKVQY